MMRALLLAAAFSIPSAACLAAEQDPFEGRTIDDLLKDIEARIADRREDSKVLQEYRSFLKREQGRFDKFGEALARLASTTRTQECVAYVLHVFGMYKPSLEVLTKLKMQYSKSARDFMKLQEVYLYMAWNYTYLDRASEADSIISTLLSRGQAFKERIEQHAAKMRKLPEARREIEAAFRRRDLGMRQEVRQWELCVALSQKAFYPVEERIELGWMEKNFPKSAPVQNGDLEWMLVLNSERLMDYAGVVRDASNFVRNKKYKDFWAVVNGDVLWTLGDAYLNLGKWRDCATTFEQLKLKYPKHQRVENGRVEAMIRYAQSKDKGKAKPDPLPAEWGRGL